MATYYTLLTKIGQARIANAVALNQMVNLTYMAVGDGNGNPTTPNENQTTLVREKYRSTINQLTVDADNPNYLVAELIVPTNVGGWSIYEVGVFDDQNQLIAVANFPATYKPELVEGSGRDLIVRIIIQVSNTSVVTLKIDPAITLASQAWVAANFVKKTTVAGGTTGQVLVKKSNANEDFQWVDQTAAVDVNVFSREETQTVATGQTILNLAQLTTDGAAIYIEGIRLRDDQFTVNSPTRLTLATSYPAGTKVTIVQNEETSRNAFMLKANNLSDLQNIPAALANLRAVDANGGDYNGYFNFKQVGTTGSDENQSYLVSPETTTANALATWLQNMWHGNAVSWGVIRGESSDIKGAGIDINGNIIFEFLTDGSIKALGKLLSTQEWANEKFPLKTSLGNASTKTVGTGADQIPDMTSFQSGSNSLGTWIRHPSGILIQFGLYPVSGPTGGISFPTPFTSDPSYSISPTGIPGIMAIASGSSITGINDVRTFDAVGNTHTNGVVWIAIGR